MKKKFLQLLEKGKEKFRSVFTSDLAEKIVPGAEGVVSALVMVLIILTVLPIFLVKVEEVENLSRHSVVLMFLLYFYIAWKIAVLNITGNLLPCFYVKKGEQVVVITSQGERQAKEGFNFFNPITQYKVKCNGSSTLFSGTTPILETKYRIKMESVLEQATFISLAPMGYQWRLIKKVDEAVNKMLLNTDLNFSKSSPEDLLKELQRNFKECTDGTPYENAIELLEIKISQ